MKVTGYKVRMQKSTVFLYMEYTTFMDGLIFVKKLTVLTLIYRFNAMPIKIPTFFGRNLKIDLKPIQNYKENQCNLEKENKIRRLMLSEIKIHSKTIVIKTVRD